MLSCKTFAVLQDMVFANETILTLFRRKRWPKERDLVFLTKFAMLNMLKTN